MLCHLEEYGKYLLITGYRNAKFSEAEAFLKQNRKEETRDVEVQFFDADLIATRSHLYFAAQNALQAFRNKTNLSKSPSMETMLYTSAQRQIQRAIQRCGIKPQTTKIAVTILGTNQADVESMFAAITHRLGVEPDEQVLEMSCEKVKLIQEIFRIGDAEVEAVMRDGNRWESVVNLVVEQVALLATQL